MGLAEYDDMMGLDFGDFDAIFPPGFLGEALKIGGVAGVSVMGLSYGLTKLGEYGATYMPADAAMKSRVMSGVAVAVGLLGSAYLIKRGNEPLGYAVLGATTGIGLASLVGSFLPAEYNTVGKPLGVLPEEMGLNGSSPDAALLAQYDQYAMNGLGATGVAVSGPAFQGFSDPTVTPERLQGFASPMVQEETLGYQPWLA